MEHAERIEITFKNGDTISYGKGEWDDYGYDGKAAGFGFKFPHPLSSAARRTRPTGYVVGSKSGSFSVKNILVF